jgi:hypothetical protein
VSQKLKKLEASVSNSSIFDDSDEKDNKLINEIDHVNPSRIFPKEFKRKRH